MRPCKRLLVTGGAGFIGSHFVEHVLPEVECLVNVDLLTYAGTLDNLSSVLDDSRHCFIQENICSLDRMVTLCTKHRIDTIVHFAAETHVDRSIEDPLCFVETNVKGTAALLEAARVLPSVHFHHISTDEVYGSLGEDGFFSESSPYLPSSPYSASKAAADHLVRAYARTYGLSVTLSHCGNNYGPRQHPEKLIPLVLTRAIKKHSLPLYGDGRQVRDWIYVKDHVEALWRIVRMGKSGETYAITGKCERRNIDIVQVLLEALSKKTGEPVQRYFDLIAFVRDRPGHDRRYALLGDKVEQELGWIPRWSLEKGIGDTVEAYVSKNF